MTGWTRSETRAGGGHTRSHSRRTSKEGSAQGSAAARRSCRYRVAGVLPRVARAVAGYGNWRAGDRCAGVTEVAARFPYMGDWARKRDERVRIRKGGATNWPGSWTNSPSAAPFPSKTRALHRAPNSFSFLPDDYSPRLALPALHLLPLAPAAARRRLALTATISRVHSPHAHVSLATTPPDGGSTLS